MSTTATEPNPYEELARERKANTLANVLVAWGVHSSNLAAYDCRAWQIVAHYAGVADPSDETRALVRKKLIEREDLAVRVASDKQRVISSGLVVKVARS
jgi:hypothetical protein